MAVLKRVWRSKVGKLAYGLVAVVIVAVSVAKVREALQPSIYYISALSLGYYKKDKVPDEVIAKLEGLDGREFVNKAELVDTMRNAVGAEQFRAHEATLLNRIRSRHCWPNTSPHPVYAIKDSRGHPLHNRFGVQVLVPQRQLPPVATQLEFLPGDQGVLVLGKFGHLTWFAPDWLPRMALQIPGVFEGGEDVGALGLALDPQFAENKFIYVGFVTTKGTQNVIQRLTLSADAKAVVASRVDILRWEKDVSQHIHGVGSLHFTRDGVMLAQVGKPGDNPRAWRNYEGTVLALIPGHGPAGGYTVPNGSVLGEAFTWLRGKSNLPLAWGLRSPFTGTMWRGNILIGDVGASGPYSHEEVNLFANRNENWGWPRCQDPGLHGDFTPPVIAYRRNDPGVTLDDPEAIKSEGRSVIVGVVYEGAPVDRYQGALDRRLIYGDFYLGFTRGARLNDKAEVEDDVFMMHLPSWTSMRIGPDGYVYGVTAIGDKGLFRLILKRPPGK